MSMRISGRIRANGDGHLHRLPRLACPLERRRGDGQGWPDIREARRRRVPVRRLRFAFRMRRLSLPGGFRRRRFRETPAPRRAKGDGEYRKRDGCSWSLHYLLFLSN